MKDEEEKTMGVWKQLLSAFFVTLLVPVCSCSSPGSAAERGTKEIETPPPTAQNISWAKPEDSSVRSQNHRFITPLERREEDKVMARVEAFHSELCKSFTPGMIERKEVIVELVPDAAAFGRRIAEVKPEFAESDSALYVRGRRILAHLGMETDALFRAVFRHQTRLYLCDLTRKFPLWIEEGLISFFEEVTLTEDRYRITGYSADKMERLQALLKSGDYPGLGKLVQLTQLTDFGEAERSVSWGFTYWAQVGGPNTNTVIYKEYLRAVLQKGAESVNIEEHLKMSLNEFQKKWAEWILKQEVFRKEGDK